MYGFQNLKNFIYFIGTYLICSCRVHYNLWQYFNFKLEVTQNYLN